MAKDARRDAIQARIGFPQFGRLVPTMTAATARFAAPNRMPALSFLVTTPEAWVPALGDAQHGFPPISPVPAASC